MQLHVRRAEAKGLHTGNTRSFVHPAQSITDLVALELAETERLLSREVSSKVPAVSEIARYLLDAGGKRLRPMLTILGARAAGHEGPISRLACAGELVHLGSLLHDDVVDDGLQRRGKLTAQRVYGNAGVILTGDYCVSRGLSIAAEEGGIEAVKRLAVTVADMSEGEVLQLLNAGNLALPVSDYYETIDKKSATLIAWCASAGALAIGAESAAEALADYGRAVGVAFQITDDALDYSGQGKQTGKRRGRDLAQRKLTLPLLLAFERRPELIERVRASAMDDESVEALIEDITGTGAVAEALGVARGHVQQAVDALTRLPASHQRDALTALAWYLVERSA
ncbi:MAG: polyprenyl synthetase family protein [Alphaproteobacteria bacterium]|nr:polyprenyl synthetase family protein [Alphaproteobacteria bacterium]